MQLTFDIHADASRMDDVHEPRRHVRRHDTWRSAARWRRGLLGGRVWFKAINLVYFLAAMATCGLGIYGSVSLPSIDRCDAMRCDALRGDC